MDSSPPPISHQVCVPSSSLSDLPIIFPINNPPPSDSDIPPVTRSHNMVTRSMNNIYRPKRSFLVTRHPIQPSLEPNTISEALSDSRWRDAMSSELTALMCHGTWQLENSSTRMQYHWMQVGFSDQKVG